jgi:adenylate cyclase
MELVKQSRWEPEIDCDRRPSEAHCCISGYVFIFVSKTSSNRTWFSSSRLPTVPQTYAERILTKSYSVDKDLEISPGSAAPSSTSLSNTRNAIAPWETGSPRNVGFGNHRKELGVLETSGGPSPRVPAINRQPPTALSPHHNPPWANGNPPILSSVFGSFYDDSSEDVGQSSPGFRPGSSQEDMSAFPGEDRRPSIASATTVSSIGSKSSVGRGFHKKLHGFFGEDFPGENSRQNSDQSLPASALFPAGGQPLDPIAARQARHRTNSATNNAIGLQVSRPGSPASFSRPRTPHSSEVTPWEFQDFSNKVRHFYCLRKSEKADVKGQTG